MMVHAVLSILIATLAAASAVQTPHLPPAQPSRASADARAAFDRLRQIAGTWTFVAGVERGRVSYELVSDGTALLERVMNDEHGEAGMVSVIHVDGDRLELQHYCGVGNQPRLVSAGLEDGEIRFRFERAGNLADGSAGHIHSAVFRFPAIGAFESSWTWRENGVETTSTRRHRR